MNVYNNTEGSGVTDINWLSENFSRYRLCFFARSIINFYKIMYFFFYFKAFVQERSTTDYSNEFLLHNEKLCTYWSELENFDKEMIEDIMTFDVS